ncbi:MAG: hypothetical protein ACOCRO_10720 [Halanaerobiales bacterium]
MGATPFYRKGFGNTPEEAFAYARDEAIIENGNRGYTGSLAEKDSFTVIDLPEGKKANEYARELIEKEDPRIDNKWGPAGCLLIKKGNESCNIEIDNRTKTGTKKWKTEYVILERYSDNQVGNADTKGKAIKLAKELAKKFQKSYEIRIQKTLISHNNVEAVIKCRKKGQPGQYLFFGWASC